MPAPHYVKAVRAGADAIAQWCATNPDVELDQCGLDLQRVRLENVNLAGADLCRADCSQPNMIKADLRNPDLTGALFVSNNMSGADFGQASLHRADFTRANWDHSITFPKGFDPNNIEFLDVGVPRYVRTT